MRSRCRSASATAGWSSAQHFINKRLVDAAREHRVVVRLKGGDPMLFGRAQEEIDALRAAGIAVEVVPGVTAALAASADLGVSLTRRARGGDDGSRSVVFVTPRVGDDDAAVDRPTAERRWIAAVNAADTGRAVHGLARGGPHRRGADRRRRDAGTPVAVVENASLPSSARSVTTLGALAREACRASMVPPR